jgi:hypothetical protein
MEIRNEIGFQDPIYHRKVCRIRRHDSDGGDEVGARLGSLDPGRHKMQSAGGRSRVFSIVLIAMWCAVVEGRFFASTAVSRHNSSDRVNQHI